MLISATYTLVTVAKKEAVENVKDNENLESTTRASKDCENPRPNLEQVVYPISHRLPKKINVRAS